ncbi:hypothetical protein CRYUN_Cryun05aG0063700 [Craigia yunnanensis]
MRTPPSLLSLTIDSAVLNLSNITDLSPLPDHILIELFLRTLRAGKLTDRVLKLFIATGKDEVFSLIQALNIQVTVTPVLPTKIKDDAIDIVIGALRSDMTSFMNEWRPIFSRFHLIIVKDPDLKEELKIPEGFNLDVYRRPDIDRVVGSSTSILFSGYSCSHTILFNSLYNPFSEGADFVRGYPFSLRSGVKCALSCGLWLNLADHDSPTQALKPGQRNSRYVDAVMTVPARALVPISGINIAFDQEVVGPALLPALRFAGEGKFRWETMEDIWSGMCVKAVCDHLGLGVKSGLPYVWRNDRAVRLPRTATTTEDCVVEVANAVKEQLGLIDPVFAHAAKALLDWVKLGKSVGSSSSSPGV